MERRSALKKSKVHAYKRVLINSLVPWKQNPRTHSATQIEQIRRSIQEFGFTNPLLVDENGQLVAGHGRLEAAKAEGMTELPVIELQGLSEAQKRALVIADNQIAVNAGWDDELLRLEIGALQQDNFDLSLVGFTEDELAEILAEPIEVGLTDPDDAPLPPANPVTVLGDVWLMGKHRVMCGDSTAITDMERLVNGRPCDMWLTDPPYNVAYVGKTKDALKIENDSMSDDQFRSFLRDAFVTADTAMKAGAVFYIWHADSEGYSFRGACRDAGWKVRQCLVWKKQTLVMGRQDYHWKHEPCLYGWKDGAGHLWAADRKQTTVLEFDRPSRSTDHPTMKPVALFEYQMLNNTKGGDIVLDSFGGSGTTCIAAEKNGRESRLMELDPKYVDVIVTRWQEFTGKQATLEADGRSFVEIKENRNVAAAA